MAKKPTRAIRIPPLLRYFVLPFLSSSITLFISSLLGFVEDDKTFALQFAFWGFLYLAVTATFLAATTPSRQMFSDEVYVLIAYSWIVTPILSALPVSYTLKIPFHDAWFESVSGYTTTGLTIFTGGISPESGTYIPAVEELPPTVLWWRASTQWIGGFGIVVLFYTLAQLGGLPAYLVGQAEGRYERLEPSIAKSLRALMQVYIFITSIAAAALLLSGASLRDSLYHAMTGVATGGFSTHSNSLGYYPPVVGLASVVGMLLGASNFADIYTFLKRMKRPYSGEVTTLLKLLATGTVGGIAILALTGYRLSEAAWDSFYHVASAITGTGFSVADLSSKPEAYKALLVGVMLVGGSVLSTTGGIKVYRVMVIAKSFRMVIVESIYGRSRAVSLRLGRSQLTNEDIRRTLAVFFSFVLTLFIGSILLTMSSKAHFVDALFEAQSALCTVGLSVNIANASAYWHTKLVLIGLMLAGRLEVIGYLYAISGARSIVSRLSLGGKKVKTPTKLGWREPITAR
ncbi:MAG: potassium transporter TrkG [Thermoproteota archaeon]